MPGLLDSPVLSRIRRNHGLEHATIHVLSRRFPGVSLAGHSDALGFWLMGELDTEAVADGVVAALERLRAGEADLAIHPGCGTNYATSGVAAGLAAGIAFYGARRRKDWWERLPLAALFATAALIFAQPLGFRLQKRVTTSGTPGALRVTLVMRHDGPVTAHRITTEG
ncbi:MAG: hypothetical protein EPO32_01010 [Anaerolineae bacterium]|nr:MAG: hypothetical protein EPO32_01010 [Anaerolineae bacterium]